MADCSELSKAIDEMVELVTTQLYQDNRNVNFDDVVAEMISRFPRLDRSFIIQAINEVHTRTAKETEDLKKVIKNVISQAKTEGRQTVKQEKYMKYLETGEVPKPTNKNKTTTFTIGQLRKTNTNLGKWLRTSDPAMKEKLTKRLEELEAKIESGEIEIEEGGKYHEELKFILDAIEDAKTKVRDEKTVVAIQKKIDDLQRHLEEGTLPAKQKRTEREHTEFYNTLVESRDILKKQIANSKPAIKEKLQKQLDILDEKIKNKTFMPVKKEKPVYDDPELQRLEFDINQNKSHIREMIYNAKPKTFWGVVGDIYDFDRLIQTTGEGSIALAQLGMRFFGHPIEMTKTTIESIKAFADPLYCAQVMNKIKNDDLAPVIIGKMGIHISPIDGFANLTKHEEVTFGHWSSKVPVIRNFSRGAITMINLARYTQAKTMYETLGIAGKKSDMEFLGKGINEMTGRGTSDTIEKNATLLNRLFYAPRWILSRFQVAFGHPIFAMPLNNEVSVKARALMVGEYARTLAGLFAFYILSMWAGGEPDWEETSPTFGQIKFHDKYIDPTFGIAKVYSLTAQIVEGEKTNTETGKVKKLTPYTRGMTAFNYLRGKSAPMPSIFWDIVTGETLGPTAVDIVRGKKGRQETTVSRILQKTLLPYPITYGDIYEIMKDEGGLAENSAISFLTFWGMRSNVYEDEGNKKKEYETYSK